MSAPNFDDTHSVKLDLSDTNETTFTFQPKPSISEYFNKTSTNTTFFDELDLSTGIENKYPMANAEKTTTSNKEDMSSVKNDIPGSVSLNSNLNIEVSSVGSDADRRREAWPLKKKLPDGDILVTMPGVTLQEDMEDPVQELVCQLLGESESVQRRLLGYTDVTQDERGIRELIQAGCYRAAINLTGHLLTIYGQGFGRAGQPAKHSPHSLQLWFARLALLAKLKCYTVCQVEAQPFGILEHSDVFYQHYPEMYGNRVGSMACFAFRLLIAELPSYWGQPNDSLTKLHVILATVRRILHNLNNNLNEYGTAEPALTISDRKESIKLWAGREARTMHSIINSALNLKDFSLASQTFNILTKSPHWGAPHRRALHSAWGRILLQLGDVIGAERQFTNAKGFRSDPNALPDLRELVDRGLLAVAQNAFQEGFLSFQKALVLDTANVMVLNNMGACLLYSGKVKEAIALLEKAVSGNPSRGLNESLLLNLCTLYELESSQSMAKKLALLQQINRFKADLTGPVQICLKLQM